MKIFFLAYSWVAHPYIESLRQSLTKTDKSLEIKFYSKKEDGYLLGDCHKKILHIHWPDTLYDSQKNFINNFGRVLNFLMLARKLQKKGVKIVWTVHDYESHECKYPVIDRFFYRMLYSLADAFIVHSEAGRNFLENNGVSGEKIYIIPFGNFIGYHGPLKDKGDARKKLGFKESDLVFLNFGIIRPYKGLENIISVFNRIKNPGVNLTIRGKRFWRFSLDGLYSLIKNKNISLVDRFVPDEEVGEIFCASDFFIMGHKKFLSSGVAILALSYGLPVIAPKTGDMPYIIEDGINGFLYEPGEENLFKAVSRALKISKEEIAGMSQNAVKSIENASWDAIAKATLKVYQDAV